MMKFTVRGVLRRGGRHHAPPPRAPRNRVGDSALAQRRENAADVCCRPKKSTKSARGEPAGPAGNARRDGNGHDAGVGRWRGRVGRFVSALRRHFHFSFDMPP
ncbi:hypothetical protein [Burkholderia pseudomallei]|uniref:hypothetical protein n=1 Tax=Burkholderia pseudomallei TaxID=28450 RepID=UPI0018A6C903|nr:hypothetical protein [Burkholderia pseudomallei]